MIWQALRNSPAPLLICLHLCGPTLADRGESIDLASEDPKGISNGRREYPMMAAYMKKLHGETGKFKDELADLDKLVFNAEKESLKFGNHVQYLDSSLNNFKDQVKNFREVVSKSASEEIGRTKQILQQGKWQGDSLASDPALMGISPHSAALEGPLLTEGAKKEDEEENPLLTEDEGAKKEKDEEAAANQQQQRDGPVCVGWWGVVQPVVDGGKLLWLHVVITDSVWRVVLALSCVFVVLVCGVCVC